MCDNIVTHAKPKQYDGFVNLHCHSSYSILDGLSKPEDMISKISSLHQHSIAVSEHGNTFSSIRMHKLAKENNIKHIYAMEAYVTEDRFVKDKNNKYYHLTILAENEQGRLNLNKLASLGYLEGYYFKPRIDHELLKKYSEGLIVLSGCLAGELQRTITGGRYDDEDFSIQEADIQKAKGTIKWYREVFQDRYYLEVQAHKDKRQQAVNRVVIDLAYEFGIDYVATTDSHYTNEEDKELHDIFIQIGTNRESGETYESCFLMNSQEVYDRLDSLTPEEREIAIRNSLVIADRCNVTLPLSEPIIPHVEVPEGFDTEEQYLKHLVNKGWIKREISKKPKEEVKKYKDRLMYEFNAIKKMGFIGYFLLVESYVNSVKRRGIARGSSGGSLICYLISITEIDPLKYNLYFERFIDVGALDLLDKGIITRKELKIPDVDSDFSPKDRDKVIDSIISKYGKDKFASLGQFGYIWDKSAIKDVGRVLNVPYSVTNQITKDMGDNTIEYALQNSQFRRWEEQYPKLFDYAKKIAGLPRSFGVHPCGRAITIKNTNEYMAFAVNDGEVVLQGDMHDAEDLGIVKVDVLSLKSLDVIYDCLEMINKDYDYINPDKLNFQDKRILDLFKKGLTEGIFQYESSGMKETLKQMKPTGLDDLGVANALYRPASIKHIKHYTMRKHGEEDVEYLHPDLVDILEPTQGILVFQESLIEIGRLGGMRNPDEIRKATSKKSIELMEKVKIELFEGLRKRDWSEDQLEQLWDDMVNFASYSLN